MQRKKLSIGLCVASLIFTVFLSSAAGQETSVWPTRQGMNVPEASRETSMKAGSKDVGIPAAGQQVSIRLPRHGTPRHGTTIRSADQAEEVLWDFGNGTDGQGPAAGVVIDAIGEILGTTQLGGMYGQGMVFELELTEDGWVEHDLHDFGVPGTDDGIQPNGVILVSSGGLSGLFGTTNGGGRYNYGTVFQLSPNESGGWTEYILHSFQGNDLGNEDGANPVAGLVADSAGTLYGTTYKGGDYNKGTAFDLYLDEGSWQEDVLHSFGLYDTGAYPTSGLIINSDGNPYGTTSAGGEQDGGDVFDLLNDGATEEELFDFPDGTTPMGSLLQVNDNIYGVTERGGDHHSGTVFEITRPGSVRRLYSFGSRGDGINPQAGLLWGNNGYLYGTTSGGGMYGHGTVFAESLGGGEDIILWSFGNGDDGSFPTSNLTVERGILLGTTVFGGMYGHGTVFAVFP